MRLFTPGLEGMVSVFSEAVSKFHPDLEREEFSLRVLAVQAASRDGEPNDNPPMQRRGKRTLAAIRATNPRERSIDTTVDAEVVVDLPFWDSATEATRLALADHELTHVEVVRDPAGVALRDVNGRLVLRMRPHEEEVGIFTEVIARHGRDSVDMMEALRLAQKVGDVAEAKTC